MRIEEPLALMSRDERSVKRVGGCSVVPADAPAPAVVAYALPVGLCAVLMLAQWGSLISACQWAVGKHGQT